MRWLLIPALFLTMAVVPTGERLDAIMRAPLKAEPTRKQVALGTTLVDAIDTENSRKTDDAVQLFVVTNTHASQYVCVGSVSAVGATCNETLCDTASAWTDQGFAGKMNCTASDASQGSIVLPGSSRAFSYDGTRCVCIVASGASTTVQVERVVR